MHEPRKTVTGHTIEKTASLHKLFSRYVFFAGVAALVNLLSRYFFSDFLRINFVVAVITAYCLGLLINFFMNKYLNFKRHDRKTHEQLRTFTVVALGGLILTTALAALIRDYLLLELGRGVVQDKETAAHVLAVGITTLYSFSMHKYFTFDTGIRHKLRHWVRGASDAR